MVRGGKGIISGAKELFKPQKAKYDKNFAEAMQRLNLTEEQVTEQMKIRLHMALIYIGIALAIFIYAIYLLINGHFFAGILAITLGVLMSVYAYREHFWYMQMKQHKLGCTFKEWVEFTFKIKVK